MISGIPRSALVLGLAGTLPFLFGAFAVLLPETIATGSGAPIFVARLLGGGILHSYGVVIFAFMSGVLWGFATKAQSGTAGRYYLLSVIPAILVFFYALYAFLAPLTGAGQPGLLPLLIGFIALLGLDYIFWSARLAPDWWMRMRVLITAIVVICLIIGEFAA